MSVATDLAEAEANAVEDAELRPDDEAGEPGGSPTPDENEIAEEAEREPDPHGEPEPEPHGEPSNAAPPSDAQIEATYKEIEKKSENYAKAQHKLLQATGVPWAICPCCQVPGFALPFDSSDPDDALRKMAVDAYFGATSVEYRDATDAVMCPDCDGWGIVTTHARNPNQLTKGCMFCNGNGWVAPATISARETARMQTAPTPIAPTFAQYQPPVPAAEPSQLEQPPHGWYDGAKLGADEWGRWPGHSRFGINPGLNGGVW